MDTTGPAYTARNSERFLPSGRFLAEQVKADKYIKGAKAVEREELRAVRVRSSAALRASERIKRRGVAELSGSPWQVACVRLLEVLLGVREAHNHDALFMHNDSAVGFIDGAKAFGAITQEQWSALVEVRKNAYTIRLGELSPRLNPTTQGERHAP